MRAAALLFALVPKQTASRAAHKVDARAGEAPNANIGPIVFTAWRGIVKFALQSPNLTMAPWDLELSSASPHCDPRYNLQPSFRVGPYSVRPFH